MGHPIDCASIAGFSEADRHRASTTRVAHNRLTALTIIHIIRITRLPEKDHQMLRSDFEGHTIWVAVDEVQSRLNQVRETGDLSNIAAADTIGFYADYIQSFRDTSAVSSPFFVPAILSPVETVLRDVISYLNNWISEGTASAYQESARVTIESALTHMGPWPRPYGKGGQVQQLTTLYEDLLERQRLDLAALQQSNAALEANVETHKTELAQVAATAQVDVSGLVSTANDVVATVNAEKARIDEVVTAGVKQLAEMNAELDKRSKAWEDAQLARFVEQVRPLVEAIHEQERQGSEALDRLLESESGFANLSAAAATDKLAGHFATEAKTGRAVGMWLYIAGGVLIATAASPLLLLLLPGNLSSDADTRWEQLVIRAGIGAALASAATVAIRLGGRFFANANVTKRMELDLKTFGPFLANVDPKEADKARINLVERALGKPAELGNGSREDSVSIGGMSQLLDAASKLIKP
ncbi:MAG: hypothetical protein JWO01_2794 [Microbacteriaceae bacterium]|nr:hypothetical protein [Microbacteriaceae bacterium]